jgi:hypothetical protein
VLSDLQFTVSDHQFVIFKLFLTMHIVYQLLAHLLCFFPGTPASATTKTGRHDIAEINALAISALEQVIGIWYHFA